ncbi:MAG TPA: hypothetical protein VJO52_16220 [Gemmatimonadaceae bacterium]|nr:hypothetical protein [Gemmatimonadaceae bacterium]
MSRTFQAARVRPAAIAILLACVLAHCGMQQTIHDILALQQGLMRQYQEAVTVNVGDSVLTVTFQNSKEASLPEADRAAMAHDVAEFVRGHYAEYGRLARVQVGFTTVHQYGPVNTSRSEVPYSYTVTGLGAAPQAAPAAAHASAPN